MKMRILRLSVLLLSVSAASLLVWHAARGRNQDKPGKDAVIAPESSQGSGKSKAIGADLSEFTEQPFVPPVTEEEVKTVRDAMLSTSKSGVIMSDQAIREMLERQKKAFPGEKDGRNPEADLIPSSKNPVRLIEPKELRKLVERIDGEPSAQELPEHPDP
jgi:hypothetical protein